MQVVEEQALREHMCHARRHWRRGGWEGVSAARRARRADGVRRGSGLGWRSADVVVTTPATKLPQQEVDPISHQLKCYRLILDESHLYERGADPKLPTTQT